MYKLITKMTKARTDSRSRHSPRMNHRRAAALLDIIQVVFVHVCMHIAQLTETSLYDKYPR